MTTHIKKRNFIVLAVIILIAAAILSSFVYLNSQKHYSGNVENLSFGLFFGATEPYAGLVYVAQNQNFFAQNGINLTTTNYATASAAVNGVLNNQVDLAISSEYVFAYNVLNQGNLSIITTVDKSQTVFLIGRTDKGIENITDLQGKKIGLTLDVAPHFYLSRFLELNNVNTQNLTLVNLAPKDYVNAVVNGSVDALVATTSDISNVEAQLPNSTVMWSVQSDQPTYILVSCRSNWLGSHQETVTRFLKSLAQAETYTINHATGAKNIVQKDFNFSNSEMMQIWSNHLFSLSLDQSLLLAMQDEAQWLVNNNLTNVTSVPNFLNYIYFGGLETVNPNSVTITH
jgi:NitT/TauT family transport system substrate-binding protein